MNDDKQAMNRKASVEAVRQIVHVVQGVECPSCKVKVQPAFKEVISPLDKGQVNPLFDTVVFEGICPQCKGLHTFEAKLDHSGRVAVARTLIVHKMYEDEGLPHPKMLKTVETFGEVVAAQIEKSAEDVATNWERKYAVETGVRHV